MLLVIKKDTWHGIQNVRFVKKKEKAFAKLASIFIKYPVRARFEQNRAHISISVFLDNDSYQIIIRKRNILGKISETILNISIDKDKSRKQNRPLLIAKLAEKKT